MRPYSGKLTASGQGLRLGASVTPSCSHIRPRGGTGRSHPPQQKSTRRLEQPPLIIHRIHEEDRSPSVDPYCASYAQTWPDARDALSGNLSETAAPHSQCAGYHPRGGVVCDICTAPACCAADCGSIIDNDARRRCSALLTSSITDDRRRFSFGGGGSSGAARVIEPRRIDLASVPWST